MPDEGALEWADDVGVGKASSVRGRVALAGVGDVGRIGFCAVSARERLGSREAGRGIPGETGQCAELVRIHVQASVHHRGGLVGVERVDVRSRFTAVDGAEKGLAFLWVRGAAVAEHLPYVSAVDAREWEFDPFTVRSGGGDALVVAKDRVDA